MGNGRPLKQSNMANTDPLFHLPTLPFVHFCLEMKRLECQKNRTEAITIGEDVSHFQIRCGESDDGGLIQLRCDGRWKWQHLGQFHELCVLLLAPRSRRVLAFLLHNRSIGQSRLYHLSFITMTSSSISRSNTLTYKYF